MSESQKDALEENTEDQESTQELPSFKATYEPEAPVFPTYDERLHFRYFVMYNTRVWAVLALLLVLAFFWRFVTTLNMNSSSGLAPTPVEPTDKASLALSGVINTLITAVTDGFTKFFQSLGGGASIPAASIINWAAALVFAALALLTFRSWLVWRRSRLIVNENGVELVEPDIPWLFVPGDVHPLNPGIVNDLAKSRDLLDILFFWNCWQATVLCNEQAGSDDEIQNVPVRAVNRLQISIEALVAHHSVTERREEKVTNQLLSEVVEELKLLRAAQKRGEEGKV